MVSNKKVTPWIATTGLIIRSYGLGHIYHVFPTMQVERHELQVEGSYDRKNWKAYTFKYKPGDLSKRPEFIIPHQPRLDWMIWFVPPKFDNQVHWFKLFLRRLSRGSPEVLALLEENPFEGKPPLYLRVMVYRYNFTSREERKQTGNWWKKELLGLFSEPTTPTDILFPLAPSKVAYELPPSSAAEELEIVIGWDKFGKPLNP
ncbi:Lipase maturation factor 2 [Nymphon striatum]|nr:Lipase maturation factor 2 [Nymphon striatum]